LGSLSLFLPTLAALLVLVLINSISAIMSFAGWMHYVVVFILFALLIGFGVCALVLSNTGGMH